MFLRVGEFNVTSLKKQRQPKHGGGFRDACSAHRKPFNFNDLRRLFAAKSQVPQQRHTNAITTA
jgi:hypothetical protein